MSTSTLQTQALGEPLTLPCGIIMPSRLAKAAMEEMLGDNSRGPSKGIFQLYEQWADGGWGMILTGNVMVSPTHLGSPFDVVLPFPSSPSYDESLATFRVWAKAAHSTRKPSAPVIMQLCHTGRQSTRGSGRPLTQPALAPSAVPLKMGNDLLGKVLFGTPKAMTIQDIKEVIAAFVQGARVAKETGFDGIELHCSHGYLLAQFLSPNVNIRTDGYGGSPRARVTLLFEIIDAIRNEFPMETGFCLGIKLNSSDYVKGGLSEQDALDNVKWIAEHGGVDFIEISGGTYENPQMLKSAKPSTSAREAFFLNFASEARALLRSMPSSSLPSPVPAIMVTGGFRTREGMAQALTSHSTDIVGVGRPACAEPALPMKLDSTLSSVDSRALRFEVKGTSFMRYLPPAILPGASTLYHTLLLHQLARREKPDVEMTLWSGIWRLWIPKNLVMKAMLWIGALLASLWSILRYVR